MHNHFRPPSKLKPNSHSNIHVTLISIIFYSIKSTFSSCPTCLHEPMSILLSFKRNFYIDRVILLDRIYFYTSKYKILQKVRKYKYVYCIHCRPPNCHDLVVSVTISGLPRPQNRWKNSDKMKFEHITTKSWQ